MTRQHFARRVARITSSRDRASTRARRCRRRHRSTWSATASRRRRRRPADGARRPGRAYTRWPHARLVLDASAQAAAAAAAALDGDREADVCIVGAGYTGLWTAYELKRAQPDLDVVVLESRFAGFGASGRNGGWVIGELAGSREPWARAPGAGRSSALQRACRDGRRGRRAVDARGHRVRPRQGRLLQVAQTPPSSSACAARRRRARWGSARRTRAARRAGRRAHRRRRRLGAPFTPHCAACSRRSSCAGSRRRSSAPARPSTRARAVTAIAAGPARTAAGDVRARRVVRATEGYSAGLRGPPPRAAADEQLDDRHRAAARALGAIGWDGRRDAADAEHALLLPAAHRRRPDRDRRPRRPVPLRLAHRPRGRGRRRARSRELRARLVRAVPGLRDVADRPRLARRARRRRATGRPSVGLDRRPGSAWAGGYVGEGVARRTSPAARCAT